MFYHSNNKTNGPIVIACIPGTHRDLAHTHQSTEAQGAVYLTMKSGLKFLSQTLASPLNSRFFIHMDIQ